MVIGIKLLIKFIMDLIKKIIMLPFKLLFKIFVSPFKKLKNKKSNKKLNYVEDLENLINLNLPISVVSIHFDEENGFRYDITSTQSKKLIERAKNEDNGEREKEISGVEEEESKESTNTSVKKTRGRPKGSNKKVAK